MLGDAARAKHACSCAYISLCAKSLLAWACADKEGAADWRPWCAGVLQRLLTLLKNSADPSGIEKMMTEPDVAEKMRVLLQVC